jgi:hypothetical protein
MCMSDEQAKCAHDNQMVTVRFMFCLACGLSIPVDELEDECPELDEMLTRAEVEDPEDPPELREEDEPALLRELRLWWSVHRHLQRVSDPSKSGLN